ncbi:spermatid nuclear transition protein 4 [Phacochoerus africanus]|uniref:spermatid nuclear transition protein 4 n=1 Tax=Phacochoerus africanus TaxID=41426 RepID=UPI001FD88A7C|nr:spermatid nuclear transition protein 4 [Phacochoerus africanus]
MSKVSRKPREPRTAVTQSTRRIKRKKTLSKPRFRGGVKAPKTTMKIKRALQRNLRRKIQTSAGQPKKAKKARKHFVSYYVLKKSGQNKKKNQNKRQNQKKRQNQNKRRGQPVPEQEIMEKPTTSCKWCSQGVTRRGRRY